MNIQKILDSGTKSVANTISHFYASNVTGSAFMVKEIAALKRAKNKRVKYDEKGIRVPLFLIASITSSCNLHCKGCYARANGGCSDKESQDLSCEQWRKIFEEAEELGISFILLAGGEPLLRKDVIRVASEYENIVFPLFTNGTQIDENYADFFVAHRNIIPIFSVEGTSSQTNERRGEGVAEKIDSAMLRMKKKKTLFGVSITITTENKDIVVNQEFVDSLKKKGCGIMIFVEYVPSEENTQHLVLSEDKIVELNKQVEQLKKQNDIVVLSFPGDEEKMGGCIAAGRGFFHINSHGGAEPCPFSPYSVHNLKENTLLEAIQSDFFRNVRRIGAENHVCNGGCTLLNHQQEVMAVQSK